jgi:hypothetical protein
MKNVTKIKKKLESANENVRDTGKELDQWKGNWDKDTSPTVITELLETYEECVTPYNNLKQTEKELDVLTQRITIFKDKLISMKQIIKIDLIPIAMDRAVKTLFDVLQKAKTDQIQMATLNGQITKATGGYKRRKSKSLMQTLFLKN